MRNTLHMYAKLNVIKRDGKFDFYIKLYEHKDHPSIHEHQGQIIEVLVNNLDDNTHYDKKTMLIYSKHEEI